MDTLKNTTMEKRKVLRQRIWNIYFILSLMAISIGAFFALLVLTRS
ncbi:MAG: hypothetical protein AAF348_03715 [Bacteroidota bacterium]